MTTFIQKHGPKIAVNRGATSSGGPGGSTNHPELSNLSFDSSGHTGFQRSTYVTTTNPTVNNDGIDTAGIGKRFSIGTLWLNTTTNVLFIAETVTTGAASWLPVYDDSDITTHSGLSNLTYDASGHTGFQRATYVAVVDPTVTNDGVDTAALGKTFSNGSLWYNSVSNETFLLENNTTSAAAWVPIFIETSTGPISHTDLTNLSYSASNHTGFQKSTYCTTTNPTINNDGVDTASIGIIFTTGDFWYNTLLQALFVARSVATGAAVWSNLRDIHATTNGFITKDDVVLTCSSSGLVTLAPSAGSYFYYANGNKYYVSGVLTKQLTNTEGLHFVYFDGATLTSSTSWSNDFILKWASVAHIYWDATNQKVIFMSNECHEMGMNGNTHFYLHATHGAMILSGIALSDIVADGNGTSNTHAQFGYSAGSIIDEDIQHTIDILTAPAQIPIFYRSGASGYWRKKDKDAFPLIYSGTAGYTGANGRVPYNQFTGATWQLTQLGNLDFCLVHYFATGDLNQQIIGIQGQASYATLNAARAGATSELANLALSRFPVQDFVAIATIIYQTDAYTNTPNARIRSYDSGVYYVDWRFSTENPILTGVGAHPNLSNLDYPSAGHIGFQKSTWVSTSAPTVNDDAVNTGLTGIHFSNGDLWYNTTTNLLYVLESNATAAASWTLVNNAVQLQGRDIVSSAPSRDSTFVYNTSTGKYELVNNSATQVRLTLTSSTGITLSDHPNYIGRWIYTFTQDGTGGWGVIWNDHILWPSGTAPAIGSLGPGQKALVSIYYDGTEYWGIGNLNFS